MEISLIDVALDGGLFADSISVSGMSGPSVAAIGGPVEAIVSQDIEIAGTMVLIREKSHGDNV